jgi:hypothetical protein
MVACPFMLNADSINDPYFIVKVILEWTQPSNQRYYSFCFFFAPAKTSDRIASNSYNFREKERISGAKSRLRTGEVPWQQMTVPAP